MAFIEIRMQRFGILKSQILTAWGANLSDAGDGAALFATVHP